MSLMMMESVVAYVGDDGDDGGDGDGVEEERRGRVAGTGAVSTSGRRGGDVFTAVDGDKTDLDFDDGRESTRRGSWIRRRRTKGKEGERGNDDEDDEDDEGDSPAAVRGDGGSKSTTRRGRESPTSPLPPQTSFERRGYPAKGILSPISSVGRQTTSSTPPVSSSKSVRFETELPNGFPERRPSGRRRPRDAGFGLTLDDYYAGGGEDYVDASPWSSLLAVFAVVAFVSWMSAVIHGLFDLFALAQ
jgi:hypothetical protein